MKYLKRYESYSNVIDELLNIIETQQVKDDFYQVIDTEDFVLKLDNVGDYLTINWIWMKTRKYSGTELFNAIIKYAENKGYDTIYAFGIKGKNLVKADGKNQVIIVNGYYTLMRWGFIPDKGINFINRILKEKYESFEDAFSDPEFWIKWKSKGVEYGGSFDLTPNSLSFKILNREI